MSLIKQGVVSPQFIEGCAAAEKLSGDGAGLVSDFALAVKHLAGASRTTGWDMSIDPTSTITRGVEKDYDLEPGRGLGELAWRCAGCQLQGDGCQVAKPGNPSTEEMIVNGTITYDDIEQE